MAYRRTDEMVARMAGTKERIVTAALALVARGGYRATSMPAIAAKAGVSTGLLYRYFPSKADLFDEVFQRASQREIDACAAAAALPGTARERLARVVDTFARRALQGRQLAWALLAEPVDPVVEADRVRFREPYRAIFVALIDSGIKNGELAPQNASTVAAVMVGAIAEALVGPLSEPPARREPLSRPLAVLPLLPREQPVPSSGALLAALALRASLRLQQSCAPFARNRERGSESTK